MKGVKVKLRALLKARKSDLLKAKQMPTLLLLNVC